MQWYLFVPDIQVYILYTVEFSPAAIGSVLIRRFRLFVVINSVVGADFDFDPVDSFGVFSDGFIKTCFIIKCFYIQYMYITI